MSEDRERRHARHLDRRRCERFDNPRRPDPEELLAAYTVRTAERIADDCGVPYNTATTWIKAACAGVWFKRRYEPRIDMRITP